MNNRFSNILFLLSLFASQTIFSQTTNNDTLIINELIQIADSISVNEPQRALTLADSAMAIAKNIGMEKFVAKCRRRKIDANYYLGEHSKAIEDLFTLLSYNEAKKDTEQVMLCLNDIGTTYAEKVDYALSLKFLYKALKLEEQKNNTEIKATIIANIGYTYFLMKKYDDAHKLFRTALKLFSKINYKDGIATTNSNIGKVFTEEEELDSALVYFNKSLQIFKTSNDKSGIAMVYNYLGTIKYHKKEYREAIKYYTKTDKMREKIGDINNSIYSKNNIAFINNLIGNSKKAISIYEEALSKVNKEEDKEAVILLLSNVNKVYASTGNYPKAYEALQKYTQLKEEVFNTEKSEQIEKLKVEYETEQKEAEIKNLKNVTELQNESLQQRKMIIFLLVGSLALLGLLGYLGISRYRMKAQQSSLELEQRLLRSQMNPHFIFNSLSVIQGYIFDGSKKDAASYLSNFGKLMRHILENSREEYVLLEKEIETLNHYIELQDLRHGGKIIYNINVDKNLSPDSVSIPPMLAQPFIENSIKHGMSENGEISITIKYTLSDNKIILTIQDNGIGISKSQNRTNESEKHNSLAISITKDRLQLLSKKGKRKYELNIVDVNEENKDKTGTRVEIELPFLEEF